MKKRPGWWAWLPGILLMAWLLWSRNEWGLLGGATGFGYGFLVARGKGG